MSPLEDKIQTLERLLNAFDVKLRCPDYASDQRLSGNQRRHDAKISQAVGKLSEFFGELSMNDREDLCKLAGRNKSGRHDPLNEWWRSFSSDHRVTCHNELARQGKEIVRIMRTNLREQ
jgi:hypothetical protein